MNPYLHSGFGKFTRIMLILQINFPKDKPLKSKQREKGGGGITYSDSDPWFGWNSKDGAAMF